jgi:hypothetical protein
MNKDTKLLIYIALGIFAYTQIVKPIANTVGNVENIIVNPWGAIGSSISASWSWLDTVKGWFK